MVAPYEDTHPFVTIIIPTLNEQRHIEEIVESLRPDYPFRYEFLIVDGGSTDRTCEIVKELAEIDATIRLIHNPKRIQSAGVNLGCMKAAPESRFIVRADAHCRYPKNFIANLHKAYVMAGRATSVVVPMITVGDETEFQKAVAIAQNSRLGNGGASHRIAKAKSGYVDHGHHALFDREFFVASGGYDERFAVNEDGEFDIRTASNGAKVWLAQECAIEYFPRQTFPSLSKQYFGYGKGRANTLLKHKEFPKIRQLVPAAVTAACFSGLLVGLFYPPSVAVPSIYLATLFIFSLRIAAHDRALAGQVFLALATMHLSWGVGFIGKISSFALDAARRRWSK
jgi:succinoglycan biosynthesis protein ExoA